jgi:hypothetical protein
LHSLIFPCLGNFISWAFPDTSIFVSLPESTSVILPYWFPM